MSDTITIQNEQNLCPATEAISILQEKWTLFIVRSLLNGPQGFNALTRNVGCNQATLAQRLERLDEVGIVRKTVHSTMPPRTSYELTAAGFALDKVVAEIDSWARQYLKPQEASAEVLGLS